MLTVQPNMLDYILTAANTLVVVPVLDQALLKGLEKLPPALPKPRAGAGGLFCV